MQRTRGASLTSGAENIRTSGRRRIGVLFVMAALVAVLDQATKLLAVEHLADGRVINIIGDVLVLRLVRNPGAAFGLGADLTILLAIVMIAVIIVILHMSRRLVSLPWAIGLGGMLGGAVGNLGDRLFRAPGPLRGHVVDFLELPNWPVFNLADSAIVGSAVVIALLSFRGIAYDGSAAQADEVPPDRPDDGEPGRIDHEGDQE